MQVESLESRIKLKAQVQLRAEIEAAARELEQMLRFGYALELDKLWFHKKEDKPEKATAYGALSEIKEKIYEHVISDREDRAIRDFLGKVDELQAQIDELRNP